MGLDYDSLREKYPRLIVCVISGYGEGGPYSEGRAFSISGGDLPKRLIESCKNKRAIDLSPKTDKRNCNC